MANRLTDKGTITAFSNPTTADYAGVFIAAGDKKMLWSDVKAYILGTGVDIGGTGAGDIITIDANQTLTNKTFTSPKINENVAVTASATEINVLDGIPATLTATELGYVDGVTSAIQTQFTQLAPRYGSIYITGASTAQTVTKTTWTTLDFNIAGGANGPASASITPDKANSKITISADGTYLFMARFSFQASVNALTHQFAVYRDGSILSETLGMIYVPTLGVEQCVTIFGLAKESAQPKDYDIRYYHNHSSDNNITISNAHFMVQRLEYS